MKRYSNVNFASNVYVVRGELKNDRAFKEQIRGRVNLKALLKILSGQGWIQGNVNVDGYMHLLSGLQQREWIDGMKCAYLKDEIVWGVPNNDHNGTIECRCLKFDCSRFEECRPGYSGPLNIDDATLHDTELSENLELPVPLLNLPDEQREANVVEEPEIISVFLGDDEKLWSEYKPNWQPEAYSENDSRSSVLESQAAIIESMPEEKLLVLAGPGTGKTYCLIEKLKHMIVKTCSIEAEYVLLLCFTRAAVKEIRERLKEEAQSENYADDISRIEIRTFDSFATRLLIATGNNLAGLDYDTRIEMAIHEIEGDPGIIKELGHFIVDEIQDLVGVRARFVRTILKHAPVHSGFTLLGDHLQGIYDYQVQGQNGELDAVKLLDWIRNAFQNDLKEHTLKNNLRQASKLAVFTSNLRSMIEDSAGRQVERFFEEIRNLPVRGKAHNFLEPDAEEGRTAILCRTNGEVLRLSSMMRKRGIEHTITRKYNAPLLPEWIFRLSNFNSDRLTRDEFEEFIKGETVLHKYSGVDLFTLLRGLTEQTGNYLHIPKLMHYLSGGGRLPDELYESNTSKIILSTIHQSKGREYDTVIYHYRKAPRDLSIDDDFSEAKIAYVAVTRAKKKLQLLEAAYQKSWLQKSRHIDERWLSLYRKNDGRPGMNAFEVGREHDIDEVSLVSGRNGAENQDYILKQVKVGDEIELRLRDDNYVIYHGHNCIGKMSQHFFNQLTLALKEVYGRKMSFLPERVEDIYVNSLYTVVKRPEALGTEIDDCYSNGIWVGVNMLGLGQLRWFNE